MSTQTESEPGGRGIKGLTGTVYEDLSTWPTPDEGALEERQLVRYLRRKEGVRMYFSGASEVSIKESCGLGMKQIYRLIHERCLEVHPDGLIFGWRGLIPHQHIRPYQRRKVVKVNAYGHGAAGAMGSLLLLYPDLKKKFDKRILSCPKEDELAETKKTRRSHWLWFLRELRQLGLELRKEWPFNTITNGYISVCRYIDKILQENPEKAARLLGGKDLEKKLLSGDGVDRPIERVFQRVEMDAHKLDSRLCVLLPQPSGGYVEKIIYRLWVIVIIEVVSRAILGYYLSLNREVSKEDVMRAIKNALSKWQPLPLSFCGPDEAYRQDAGFPSALSPRFLGVCWDQTSVDGALAETCKSVRLFLKEVVKSELQDPSKGFSSRRSKDDRPFVESFFKKLSTYGFQRLTNTTGGNIYDKKGHNPDLVALNSRFQFEYAEELLDVMIANYNATPHTALGNRSPLKYLEFLCSRPDVDFRYADPYSVSSILSFRKKCRVLGGFETGRRPYVNFASAKYTNEILSQRHDLVGQFIWVTNHLEEDARIALGATLDGASLGVLRAAPPWHKLPHSLKVRKAIISCNRRGAFDISSHVDAVEVFLNFSESQKNKKLPVHSAYLEERRILMHQAENHIGQTLLEEALAKGDKQGQNVENNTVEANKSVESSDTESRPLPSRRPAAFR